MRFLIIPFIGFCALIYMERVVDNHRAALVAVGRLNRARNALAVSWVCVGIMLISSAWLALTR